MCDDERLPSIKIDLTIPIRTKWAPVRVVGAGAFGKVLHVMNVRNGAEAAMKLERSEEKDSTLKIEREVMTALHGNSNAIQYIESGMEPDYRYLVMTLCGMDLQKVSERLNGKFTDSTIIRIAIRSLLALKAVHEVGYIHRDLKPCNVTLDSYEGSPVLFVIDFGIARQYAKKQDDEEWIIRRPRSGSRFRGNPRYCSVRMHNRKEQGRVDDLFAWLYMIVELKISLPWARLIHEEHIAHVKSEFFSRLIENSSLTKMYEEINALLRPLEYEDRPDYHTIYDILNKKRLEMNVNHLDPLDYDGFRTPCNEIEGIQRKYGKKSKEVKILLNEKENIDMIEAAFRFDPKNDVPGGKDFLVEPLIKLAWGSVGVEDEALAAAQEREEERIKMEKKLKREEKEMREQKKKEEEEERKKEEKRKSDEKKKDKEKIKDKHQKAQVEKLKELKRREIKEKEPTTGNEFHPKENRKEKGWNVEQKSAKANEDSKKNKKSSASTTTTTNTTTVKVVKKKTKCKEGEKENSTRGTSPRGPVNTPLQTAFGAGMSMKRRPTGNKI